MDTKFILLSLFQLILAIVMGVMVLLLGYKVIKVTIIKKYGITGDNTAFAILCSGMLFAMGNIIQGMVGPIANALRQLSTTSNDLVMITAKSVLYIGAFAGIGFLVAFLVNFIAIKLFVALTHVDEFEEISKNNIATGLITGTIVVVISLFAKAPAAQLMEAIIPYPALPGVL